MTMKEKRRLEVLLETHEVKTISFKRGFSSMVFCPRCRAKTLHLSVSEAASILQFPESAVFRFTETEQVHSMEKGGMIRLCGKSLSTLDLGHQEDQITGLN